MSSVRHFEVQIPSWVTRILSFGKSPSNDVEHLRVLVKLSLPTIQDAIQDATNMFLTPLTTQNQNQNQNQNLINNENIIKDIKTQHSVLRVGNITPFYTKQLSYLSPSLVDYKPVCDLITPYTFEKHPLVTTVKKVLNSNDRNDPKLAPQLCNEGVGGTYFIKDEHGKKIAVFKPHDEEPGAINNPKDSTKNSWLLPPGNGYLREVAAYLLDEGFAGVPETVLVSDLSNPLFSGGSSVMKRGSLQAYIDHDCDASSLGSTLFTVDNVLRIGILDIRLFNLDRNGENLLVRRPSNSNEGHQLVPIDHTYTLPSRDNLDSAWFDWQYWKQTKQPFSQFHLDYIASINVERDAAILRKLGLEEQSIDTMKVSTTLLKKGAAAGLTLFEITSLVTRKPLTKPSMLEQWVKQSLVTPDPRSPFQLVNMALFASLVDDYLLATKKSQ